jgi:hypothetical protein
MRPHSFAEAKVPVGPAFGNGKQHFLSIFRFTACGAPAAAIQAQRDRPAAASRFPSELSQ